MSLLYGSILVDAESDHSDSVSPFLLVICDHLLSFSHGAFGVLAPGCPELEHDDLVCIVVNVHPAFFEHSLSSLDHAHGCSN